MKILLVEDDQMISSALKMALERDGFTVVTSSNGNEALKALEQGPFDTIVTDIIMPDREGIETIILIKRKYPGMKIIAMSSGGRAGFSDLLEMARKSGADDILKKPFKPAELIQKIRSLGT